MRFLFISILITIVSLFAACTKTPDTQPKPDNQNNLEGGKGGPYNLAFFSKANGGNVSSRMYLKYAADKMPADTTLYDEKMNTMVEPGFGPHTHFNSLTKGTYYLFAKSASAQADTVIILTDSSKKDKDIYLNLK